MTHTLLLADDSVTIQRVIELTFAEEDVQVVAVSDGDQAIERLEAAPPDIVLADIGMPGRNGYQVAQYVKDSPRLAHIPVVLLTGAFEPVDEARASQAGCDGVLAKPFEPQLVIGRVKELLAKTRPGAASETTPGPGVPVASASQPEAAAKPADLSALDYFDRLDAISTYAVNPASDLKKPATSSLADEIDWFGSAPAAPAEPPPAAEPKAEPAQATAAPSVEQAGDEPIEARSATEAPAASVSIDTAAAEMAGPASAEATAPAAAETAPAAPEPVAVQAAPIQAPAPAANLQIPSLAEAFATILAAEQAGTSAPARWPAPAPTASLASDDLVAEVTRRVLADLSDRVVRETVGQIVGQVAERLVREEIERIKSAIQ